MSQEMIPVIPDSPTIEGNLGLVGVIAGSSMSRPIVSMDYDDLFQEGVFGLASAVEDFDPSKGFKFSTFARDRIKKSISRGIDNQDRMIRVPAGQAERMRADFRRDGEYGSPDDEMIQRRSKVMSAEALDDAEPGSVEPPCTENGYAIVEDQLVLDSLISGARLTQEQKRILSLFYGLGDGVEMSNGEVADELGVSAKRIEHLKANALSALRDYIEARGIDRSALYS